MSVLQTHKAEIGRVWCEGGVGDSSD